MRKILSLLLIFGLLLWYGIEVYPQTINGVKVKLAQINNNDRFLLLEVINNSRKKVILQAETDIILAIDKEMRQSYGSFFGERELLRKLSISREYRYEGILHPGSVKKIYVFFDERSNIQLNSIKTIIYHFNGLKFRLI